jgi:hypothetical protein
MPRTILASFKSIGILIGTLTGILGFVQAYTLLPYRVTESEKRVITIEMKREIDRELLIQIARDVQYLREMQRGVGVK